VSTYHRLLVWDIEKAPKVTRYADRVLNPLVGKSLVVYLEKPSDAFAATIPDGATEVTEPQVVAATVATARVPVAESEGEPLVAPAPDREAVA
jgi:hypothetical protein